LTAGSPGALETALPARHFSPIVLPGGFPGASVIAFGAARVPFSARLTHGFSLLQGGLPADESNRSTRRARWAAVALGVAFLSCVVALEVARWTAARQVATVRRQIRTEFSSAVPEAKVVVRETTQIREKIAALAKQRAELGLDNPPVTPLLGAISSALPDGKTLSVKEISIDGPRVRVTGESSGSVPVDNYRTTLKKTLAGNYDVTVQESRGSARGDSVSFTILIERGKGDRAS
jgi:type II secretory pathway component PulL